MAARKVSSVSDRQVEIPLERTWLQGQLNVPHGALGAVVFAHGSGSGRFSPRNQFVARVLNEAGVATLLLDLLDEAEAEVREYVFDVELLADRLELAAEFMADQSATAALPLGFFGASTGAGAALIAAANRPGEVAAVVSRGGRPDLAMSYLPQVEAPTLLIVGGEDEVVLGLNEKALSKLRCTKRLAVIPGASHLFPEPGKLEEAARLAKDWFLQYLPLRLDRSSKMAR